jgi:hypothetical protein
MTTGAVTNLGDQLMNYYHVDWSGGNGKYDSNGEVVYHGYSKNYYEYVGNPVKRYYLGVYQGTNTWSIRGDPGGFSSYFTSNENARLQQKLLNKVNEHSFNMAVALAEGKQTLELAISTLKTVGGVIHDLKHLRFESAVRRLGMTYNKATTNIKVGSSSKGVRVKRIPESTLHPNDVAGRFLELKFGWEPLLQDVYDASEAFHMASKHKRRSRVTVSRSVSGVFNGSQSPTLYTGHGTVKCTRRIIYEMSEKLSLSRQLGLVNPASVIWELIPFSFIADWFIPIGTYIDNVSMIPWLEGTFITTDFQEYRNSMVWTYTAPGVVYVQPALKSGHIVRIQRTITSGLATALPEFKPWPKAMSTTHLWESIALLSQEVSSSMSRKR